MSRFEVITAALIQIQVVWDVTVLTDKRLALTL